MGGQRAAQQRESAMIYYVAVGRRIEYAGMMAGIGGGSNNQVYRKSSLPAMRRRCGGLLGWAPPPARRCVVLPAGLAAV